jgi:hypothetical protein
VSLTLGTIITAIRALHPAFDRSRVPDTVLASFLSDYQNTLIALGVDREKTFLSQTIAIAITPGVTDAPEGGEFVDLGVDGVPFLGTREGYLVELDPDGTPFINTTSPVMITVDQGITLPTLLAPIGGTVRFLDGSPDEALCIASYTQRFSPPSFPAVYFIGQDLHLVGVAEDWVEVASIEIRHAPVAPALATLDDLFLLPDQARPALVANGATCAADRAAAYAQSGTGPTPDVRVFAERAMRAEQQYLSTFRLAKRARVATRRFDDY